MDIEKEGGSFNPPGTIALGSGALSASGIHSGGEDWLLPEPINRFAPNVYSVEKPTPLITILERLEIAEKMLGVTNEQLAGAAGRLGAPDPSRDGGEDTGRASGPGFVNDANARLDDLVRTIEATAALADAFCSTV